MSLLLIPVGMLIEWKFGVTGFIVAWVKSKFASDSGE